MNKSSETPAHLRMCEARRAFVESFEAWLREASPDEAALEADGTVNQIEQLIALARS